MHYRLFPLHKRPCQYIEDWDEQLYFNEEKGQCDHIYEIPPPCGTKDPWLALYQAAACSSSKYLEHLL